MGEIHTGILGQFLLLWKEPLVSDPGKIPVQLPRDLSPKPMFGLFLKTTVISLELGIDEHD